MQLTNGSWRGNVEVFMYLGKPRIKIHSGAQQMERRRQNDGSFDSVPTGQVLTETVIRIPRNLVHFVATENGGTGFTAKWKAGEIHRCDIYVRSERHCSLFLIGNQNQDQNGRQDQPQTPQVPQDRLEGFRCSDCGHGHRWTEDGCHDNCKPDDAGWAHDTMCPRVVQEPEDELVPPTPILNDVPRRPKDPDYAARILQMANARNRDGHIYPIAMVGPSQCGKTSIAVEIAKRRESQLFSNAFSLGLDERTILGRLVPTREAGVFEWQDSQFVQAIETDNSVYLADEFDAGDENCLLVFNTALANGWCRIAERHDAPMASRKLDNLVLAAMNTYGTGSNIYVGRQQLDASTRQRFNPITVDYNPAWEWDVVYGPDSAQVERSVRDELVELTKGVRKAINSGKLRQVWSTTNITMAMAMVAAGFKLSDYTREQFASWSDPERLVLTNNGVQVPARP